MVSPERAENVYGKYAGAPAGESKPTAQVGFCVEVKGQELIMLKYDIIDPNSLTEAAEAAQEMLKAFARDLLTEASSVIPGVGRRQP